MNNPYIQQLGMLPQQQPLQGILSPTGLMNIGAGILQANQPGVPLSAALGAGFQQGINAVDQYNQQINQNAYKNAALNLEMGKMAADQEYRNASLALDKERVNIARAEALKPSMSDTLREIFMKGYPGGLSKNLPYEDNQAKMTVSGQPSQAQGILLQPQNELEFMAAISNPSAYLNEKMKLQGEAAKNRAEGFIPDLKQIEGAAPNETAINQARDVFGAYTTINSQLDKLEKLYSEEGRTLPFTQAAGEYDTIRGTLLGAAKSLETLGTLDKGVQEYFDKVMSDPAGLSGITGKLPDQIKQYRSYINDRVAPFLKARGYTLQKPIITREQALQELEKRKKK